MAEFENVFNHYASSLTYLLILFMGLGLLWDRHRGSDRDPRETFLNLGVYVIGLLLQLLLIDQWRNHVFQKLEFLYVFEMRPEPLTYVLAFISTDLVYYWTHRLEHRWPFLWAQHCVHHSSPELNLSTAGRLPWFMGVFGWVAFLPNLILGFPPDVLVAVWTTNMFIQSLAHMSWVPKLGFLDSVFGTPSNHRVHHAANPEYLHHNFGSTLIIWDRIFGTYKPESIPVIYGCGYIERSKNPVIVNLRPMWEYLTGCHFNFPAPLPKLPRRDD